MIVYDDLEQSEKIKVYDKGITLNRRRDPAEKIYQILVGYRTGDMLAPNLDMTEALRVEAAPLRATASRRRSARSPTGRPASASCRSSRPPPSR